MKFIHTTLALLITLNLFGQETILIQPEFKENSTYLSKMKMHMVSASVSIKDSVETDMPAMDMAMNMILSQSTESKRTDGSLPMIMKYDSISMTTGGVSESVDAMETLVKNGKVYSSINNGYEITIDSFIAEGVDPSMKEAIGQTMKEFTGIVEFPEHEIKVGESFDQDLSKTSSMSAQMPGSTMVVTYTLEKIENNIAYFSSVVKMAGEMGEMMKMNGTGIGTMTYDINERFVNNNNTTMTMIMDMNMAGEGMHMEMTMVQTMEIELVK